MKITNVDIKRIKLHRPDAIVPEMIQKATGGSLSENIGAAIESFSRAIAPTRQQINTAFEIPVSKDFRNPLRKGVLTLKNSAVYKDGFFFKLSVFDQAGNVVQPDGPAGIHTFDEIKQITMRKDLFSKEIMKGLKEADEDLTNLLKS